MGIKFRLIAMNFLQYAIWGSWLISLGAYLGGGLDFSGLQIGSFFATMGIASLFMPAVMGIIADRWIPAQKLLGICHFISGAFLIAAASQTAYAPLYSCMLLSVMFYMPTIALSNSVAYNALDLADICRYIVADVLHHCRVARGVGDLEVVAAVGTRMHVVLLKQVKRFVYRRALIEHEANGRRSCDVHPVGLLISGIGVDEQHPHGQASFVHAVKRRVRGRERCYARSGRIRQLVFTVAKESQVNHGNRCVAIRRIGAHQHARRITQVEVTAKDCVAF